jgi:DNA-binding MarR family transcriptional regulator
MIMSTTSDIGAGGVEEDLVVRAIMRLGRRLRRSTPTLDLSGGALALLIHLHRTGPMSGAALARAEGLQPQSLSRVLTRMESEGLIARDVDPNDRRRHVIGITDRGRRALSFAMTERRRRLAAMMDERLDAEERATLIAAAEIMLKLAG